MSIVFNSGQEHYRIGYLYGTTFGVYSEREMDSKYTDVIVRPTTAAHHHAHAWTAGPGRPPIGRAGAVGAEPQRGEARAIRSVYPLRQSRRGATRRSTTRCEHPEID